MAEPTRNPYVYYNLSLDGDRIYGTGGISLPIDATDEEVKRASELFRKVRSEFQTDLHEALAPTNDWFWTDEVIHRLSFDDITRLMTVEEAAQVPFPIQKNFSGVDTHGKTIGQIIEMDASLVTWLALELCPQDQYDKQPPARKRAIAAAHVLIKDYSHRKQTKVAKKKEDF